MIHFKPIDIENDRETLIKFRKDSFEVSFGDDVQFDREDYIQWLAQKQRLFPDGFVIVKENKQSIGQLELSIKEYGGQDIGYVHLYYLIPEKRNIGLGKALHDYAMEFFKKRHVKEYHLRVSPTNERALGFYLKSGMEKLGKEIDGKVIRMKGRVIE